MYTDPSGLGKISIPKTAEEHYKRNLLNIWLPNTYQEAIDEGWILLAESKSVYHNSNAPTFSFNKKFISKDWHKEAVYDYDTWKLITSAEDMWTYNYYSPLTDDKLHAIYDVKPYFDFWNSELDKTTEIERYLKSANYVPAKINEWIYATEKEQKNINYKINRFNQIDFINNLINYAK
jgi:hypothetical protein